MSKELAQQIQNIAKNAKKVFTKIEETYATKEELGNLPSSGVDEELKADVEQLQTDTKQLQNEVKNVKTTAEQTKTQVGNIENELIENYATKEELNSYATKEELSEVADSIRSWAAGTQYEVGDTVLVYYNKYAATHPNTQRMYKCKTAHTSKTLSTDYLKTYWEEIFMAARAYGDEAGNNIKDYYTPKHTAVQTFLKKTDAANDYATKKEMTSLENDVFNTFGEMSNFLLHSNIVKLGKGETFDIEPNMLIMVTSNLKPNKEGNINCINYTSLNSDGEQTARLSKDVSMILFFSVKTNEAIDGVNADLMCRVACMSYSTTEFMSVEIPSVTVLNSGVWSPKIINTSNDDNVEVYVYYMKQGE